MTNFKEILRKGFEFLNYGKKKSIEEKFCKFGYRNLYETSEIKIMEPRSYGKKILAILDEIIVVGHLERNPYEIRLYSNYNIKPIYYNIKLNKKNFPGLIDNSKIERVLLLRYMRKITDTAKIKSWRLIIITDKSQIYHNFPSRNKTNEGMSKLSDINCFEESVVWELPERKFPSRTKECREYEYYIPCLPKECYELHPIDNSSVNFIDKYGNGGFPLKKTVKDSKEVYTLSRFYIPQRNKDSNSFCFMGGIENDYQLTVIGTYKNALSIGTRICLFSSSDGGREWYCKYEFGDLGEYEFVNKERGHKVTNWGNPIFIEKNFLKQKYYINCRKISFVGNSFIFGFDSPIEIEYFSKDIPCCIKTIKQHNLENSNIIAITSDIKDNDEWFISKNLKCEKFNETKLFKIEVVDDFRIKLYEFVANPINSISCRHIHHINRIKDGYIIGTGEIYPNGWLFFIPCKEGDYWSPHYDISEKRWPIIRLNDRKESVQRTMGAILYDDEDNTFIIASDFSLLTRPNISIGISDNKYLFQHSSNGVWKGRLEDCNDFTLFKSVHESKEVCYFFKEIDGIIIYGGQLGEVSYSTDKGKSWKTTHLKRTLIHMNGNFVGGFSINQYIFLIK